MTVTYKNTYYIYGSPHCLANITRPDFGDMLYLLQIINHVITFCPVRMHMHPDVLIDLMKNSAAAVTHREPTSQIKYLLQFFLV